MYSAALPLPDSPPETPTISRAEQSTLPPLAQSNSYRSQLSIDQKLQNMHDGMPALFDPVLGHVSSENLTGSKSKLNQAAATEGDEAGKRVTFPRDVKSKSQSSLHRSDSNALNRESSIPRRKSTIGSQRKVSDASQRRGSVGVPSSSHPPTAKSQPAAQGSRSHATLTKNGSGSSDGSGAFDPSTRQPGHQPNHPSPLNNSQTPIRGGAGQQPSSSHSTVPRHASGPASGASSGQRKGPPRPKLL